MRKLTFGRALRAFGWKPSIETEVREELRHHMELLTAEGVRRGLSPDAAEAEARRRFGNDAAFRAACERVAASRDRRRSLAERLAALRDDLRWSVRSLRRSPVYALASGSTLALVVAANALAFSVVYAILIRPLPYPEADRLVAINERTQGNALWELSLPNLDAYRDQSRTLAALGAWFTQEVTFMGEDTRRIQVASVAGDFFPVLGVGAARGRLLEPADQSGQSGPVAVLSHGAWQAYFGGDPGVVGRTMRLDADLVTIVGVMPPSFRFPDPEVAAWTPLGPPQPWMQNRAVHIFQVVGRLRAGTTVAAAAQELATISERVDAAHPGEDTGHRAVVADLAGAMTGKARTALLVLLASVGAMLLIACANLAGLTLTRATAREGELALRAALGATRRRLARQLLTESLVLGLVGGVTGLALAAAAFGVVIAALPRDLPRPNALRLDGTVLGVTFLLAAASGLLIGLLAAVRASRPDLRDRLHHDAARSTGGAGRQRTQRALVVAQVAVTLVLLSGGGLLLRSLRAVVGVDPGFRPEGLAMATVSLPADRYDGARTVQWYDEIPGRLASLPGVVSASGVSNMPVSGGDGNGTITIEGQTMPPGDVPGASFRRVLPGYFQTVGIPLLRGRDITPQDRGTPMVTLISEAMAKRFWPDGDPIGARIKIGPPEAEPWVTVIGVVGDVHNERLDAPTRYDTYEPFAQRPGRTMQLVVRTAGDPGALVAPLRAALREADPDLPVWGTSTMEERISASVAPRAFLARVIGGFGAAALLLAAIGVYGVTAYGVSRRRREFAIRIALGAPRTAVRSAVLRQALGMALVGALIGLPAALLLTRLIRGLLFGVSAGDPATFGVAAVLLGALAVAAAWLPARQATRSDPVAALRE